MLPGDACMFYDKGKEKDRDRPVGNEEDCVRKEDCMRR